VTTDDDRPVPAATDHERAVPATEDEPVVPAATDRAGLTEEAPLPAAGPPDPGELEAVATPATLRRAPRFGAFLRTGALAGAVVGLVLAIAFTGTEGEARTAAILLTTAGVAVLGTLVSAGLAVAADRRSRPAARRDGTRPPRGR
jgi:hypothetical protein